MHLCIVGSGASGWLVANQLKEHNFITKVTIIGSPNIPHIGVGESTTLSLPKSHSKFNVDLGEFIRESHAAVKYGVYYQNWSQNDWIHFFKSESAFKRSNPPLSARKYIQLLGNKPTNIPIHDLYGKHIWREAVGKNNVFPKNRGISEADEEYPHTFHFDAGQYINYLKKQAFKSSKIEFVEETVENVNFSEGGYIQGLNLTNNINIVADYYVNTTGQRLESKNIFNEQYDSLEDVLLTTKAVVYPLEYTNKREQFHPYTVAKTMKHGWRWITPTWERIGTGYTFSDNHISVDEAVNEFITDIGDKTIQPNVVDFRPRVNKQTFKLNSCSIGMANGFLEPLDAPGLALTNQVTSRLEDLLKVYNTDIQNKNLYNNTLYNEGLDILNNSVKLSYNFWVTFILNQYKTCYRNDTQFWVDHKNVKWDEWDIAMKDLNAYCDIHSNDYDVMMLAQTTAARNIQYYTPLPNHITPLNFPLDETLPPTQHHLDWIESFHKL
jgi:tryptophan halogenase